MRSLLPCKANNYDNLTIFYVTHIPLHIDNKLLSNDQGHAYRLFYPLPFPPSDAKQAHKR